MAKSKDRFWVGPELQDGNRPFVRETDNGRESGVVGNVQSPDSIVELEHVEGCCFSVKNEIKFTASGPAQVSTGAYRQGWDRLWGKATVGQA